MFICSLNRAIHLDKNKIHVSEDINALVDYFTEHPLRNSYVIHIEAELNQIKDRMIINVFSLPTQVKFLTCNPRYIFQLLGCRLLGRATHKQYEEKLSISQECLCESCIIRCIPYTQCSFGARNIIKVTNSFKYRVPHAYRSVVVKGNTYLVSTFKLYVLASL